MRSRRLLPGIRRAARVALGLALLLAAPRARAQALAPLEVTVTEEPRVEPPRLETRVGGEEGRRGAGTQGDSVKVLQSLPGMARTGAGSGDLVVWGSSPRETRVYVDGVELPALYHGSGIRSVLPPGWIARLTLLPGAYDTGYGRGLGGLVRLDTRAPDPETWHAGLQLDPLDVALNASVPIGGIELAVAARHSLVDRWLPELAADSGSLLSVPRYRDAQVKLRFHPEPRATLELVQLASADDLERQRPSSDPAARIRDAQRLAWTRWYVRYVRDEPGARIEVTPFAGLDRSQLRTSARDQRSGLELSGASYGIRASYQLAIAAPLSLRLGLDAKGSATQVQRAGSLSIPAREGDAYVFGQLPSDESALDEYGAHILCVAPNAELAVQQNALTLSAGLRLDGTLIESDRVRPAQGRTPPIGRSRASAALEPRGMLEYALDPRVRLRAAAGLYHQAPEPEELSASFGNPELGLSRAVHVSLAEEVRFTPSLGLELTGFYKRLANLTQRSPLSTPETAQVLVGGGTGRSFGVQLLVRQTLSEGWSGWLAATLSRSERSDGSGATRLFDYDQPVALAAVVNKLLGPWSFGARARLASGSPRAQVSAASFNASADRYEPLFGPGRERLPAFFQLDLRVDRRYRIADAADLFLYLDASNVTAQRNTEDWVYGADYRQRAALLGLPPLLLLGARLER